MLLKLKDLFCENAMLLKEVAITIWFAFAFHVELLPPIHSSQTLFLTLSAFLFHLPVQCPRTKNSPKKMACNQKRYPNQLELSDHPPKSQVRKKSPLSQPFDLTWFLPFTLFAKIIPDLYKNTWIWSSYFSTNTTLNNK